MRIFVFFLGFYLVRGFGRNIYGSDVMDEWCDGYRDVICI